MSAEAVVVFWGVVLARLIVPLLIPRYPLPAILACLVIDGMDQTIFQAFGYDPPGYQGYDKAMDVYYLAIAYMSTLRNWTSRSAFDIGRFLYFYRLVGVVAFELTQVRALLLVFANTFEYFFIAYEAIRSRWNPARIVARFWFGLMAAIWILVKLPQEWWIHVAQLDFTDAVRDVPWFAPALVALGVIGLALVWTVVRPRLPPVDWAWRFAADPLPAAMDTAADRGAWIREHGRVWSVETAEKVVLIGLISVVFGRVLPGVESSELELFIGIGILVVINAAWSVFVAARAATVESIYLAGFVRFAFNCLVVIGFNWLLGGRGGGIDLGNALFFLFLLSLLAVLHDRYRPVAGVRFASG